MAMMPKGMRPARWMRGGKSCKSVAAVPRYAGDKTSAATVERRVLAVFTSFLFYFFILLFARSDACVQLCRRVRGF